MYGGVGKKQTFPHCVILSLLSLLPKQSAAAEFPSVVLCLMAKPSGLSGFFFFLQFVFAPANASAARVRESRHNVCADLC